MHTKLCNILFLIRKEKKNMNKKEKNEEKKEGSQLLSDEAKTWISRMNFRAEMGGAYVAGLRGIEETFESREVARAVASRLKSANLDNVMLKPYSKKRDLTVSSLKSADGPRKLLEGSFGLQRIESGSFSEIGMAIDTMVYMTEGNKDCLSEPEEVTVAIPILGITVQGHTDGSAFDEKPVEIKTVQTFTPQIGFTSHSNNKSPFWNINRYLMQLGLYQLAKERNGFLVIVARDTGAVVCFEVDYEHAKRTLSYHFKKWLKRDICGFRSSIESYKKDGKGNARNRDNYSINREEVLG